MQQDFNLYVVNLFDTYHASKVLGSLDSIFRHPYYLFSLSLIPIFRLPETFASYPYGDVLRLYSGQAIPTGRLANTVRMHLITAHAQSHVPPTSPLPEEMLAYARSDTHFLLFIYDNLRNALLDRAQSRAASRAQSPSDPSTSTSRASPSIPGEPSHALVREVLSRSEETALRVYEREVYDESGAGPGGWDTLARKWNKGALMAAERDSARRRIYRAVHAWRDRVAREEDESTRCAGFPLLILGIKKASANLGFGTANPCLRYFQICVA